ncbi:response regulator [Ammoniphilus sp. CFH 90114]|uniref:response regulator n=1 Tax=Ammoniphilus sp. CFH 90114 TaxID=2493665 RepID=UPI00100E30CA|nr:response regulator [Ammoniphilus sp. CFH 90114]RXT06276.1 response regulator [Ammoniphilus sp. CFH 90114]
MNKYQSKFIANKIEDINQILNNDAVEETELYRFLHTVKGTAGTIGLSEWSEVAEKLESKVNKDSTETWDKSKTKNLLLPFIILSTTYDSFKKEDFLDDSHQLARNQEGLVLIIDDDTTLLTYLKDTLERENIMTVIATDLGVNIIENFYNWLPECVILDINMPVQDGFDILSKIQEPCSIHHIPIIMMSSFTDRETRLKSYTLADDFIQKPITDQEEFIIRVKKHIQRRRNLLDMTLIDQLTGVFNLRYLHNELARQLHELRRSNEPFTLALINLDQFRNFNQQRGYHIGDELLKAFSTYLKNSIRPTDHLSRSHSDEFILLLSKTKKAEGKTLLERLLSRFRDTSRETWGTEITFSAKIAQVDDSLLSIEHCLSSLAFNDVEKKGNTGQIYEARFGDSNMRKLHIGIIDDDSLVRELLTEQLSDIGGEEMPVEIRSYENGQQFFNDPWHNQQPFYFLIVDRVMPKMDGLAVLHHIRQNYDRRKYRVMMLTSRGAEGDIALALQKGADDYMTKPFSMKELHARVRRLIRGLV